MVVSWNGGTPEWSILVGLSIINHPAIGIPAFSESSILGPVSTAICPYTLGYVGLLEGRVEVIWRHHWSVWRSDDLASTSKFSRCLLHHVQSRPILHHSSSQPTLTKFTTHINTHNSSFTFECYGKSRGWNNWKPMMAPDIPDSSFVHHARCLRKRP